MILFIQAYGLGSPGGGAKILRSILKDAPHPWISLAVLPYKPPLIAIGKEVHVRQRPAFGRLEQTRLFPLLNKLESPWRPLYLRRMVNLARYHRATAVHVVAHAGYDCVAAWHVAKTLKIPLHVSVHDDPRYAIKDHSAFKRYDEDFGKVWANAHSRTVISQEMGEAMCARWVKRDYIIITDGLSSVKEKPSTLSVTEFVIYFAGLFHAGYADNLRALQEALVLFQQLNPSLKIKLRMRCGTVPARIIRNDLDVEILPFADEKVVQAEMSAANVLYMPLGFGEEQRPMNSYSLSTKMVSYLGSGIPIFYHGPDYAAAGRFLDREQAAVCGYSLQAKEIINALDILRAEKSDHKVTNALIAARKYFLLSSIRERFWNAIGNSN